MFAEGSCCTEACIVKVMKCREMTFFIFSYSTFYSLISKQAVSNMLRCSNGIID